jgi:cystathionine beta-lyase
MTTDRDLITDLIHHGYRPPDSFDAVAPGVFKASTVIFKNTAALHARDWQRKTGYTYGLHGTPTSFTLEERLATLEGARHALLVPSGLAAIALVDTALLQAGDEVLLPDNVYGPSGVLAREELARWGITHRRYDAMDAQALAAMIGPQTKLVWLEAAGSVTMEFPDLVGLIAACKARGVLTALDNTWGSGLAFQPFELGVDVSMQALTKYASGGADVLMGVVTTRDEALHRRLLGTQMRFGWGVGANDLELVLRSLPTLALRYDAHDAAARQLARWWRARPEVTDVLHPALDGSPGHVHWQALSHDRAAGLFSVVFDARYRAAQIDAFVDALTLYKIGYSWGGPTSLAVPYDGKMLRGTAWGERGTLVRFSIGLEAVADLQADAERALAALG